nr:restriction endonuclease subunit S [Novosphingopyxis sp. YJ-S2-01]
MTIASTGFCALRASEVDCGYLAYAVRSDHFIEDVISRSVGVSYPAINADELVTIKVPVPSQAEQHAITAFLDRETAKIDAAVAAQERLITLLAEKRAATISHAVTKGLDPDAPMKASGIEWLGQIPAHWEISRVANIFSEVVEASDDTRPVLSVSIHDGVSDDEIEEDDRPRMVVRSEDRSKYKAVEPGDLVYNMMRAWQGGFGSVRVRGAVSPAYVVARPAAPNWAEYANFVLRTPQAVTELKRYSRGVTDFRLRLYWDEFKNIVLPKPPANEITEILDHISSVTADLEELEMRMTEATELLGERRAALISAAVTGKIDVRGEVTADNVVSLDEYRAAVGAVAIAQLGKMGRMAVMKGGYLAEAYAGMRELQGHYERNAAGPYCLGVVQGMERGAADRHGIAVRESEGKASYDLPAGFEIPTAELRDRFGIDRANRFLSLLTELSEFSREGVEAIATLYAAWNDLLASGGEVYEVAVHREVLDNWHPEKREKFNTDTLTHWMDWMRRNGVVPDGTAPRTDHQAGLEF